MLFVERSNRTERLLEGLADRLMAPCADPLATSFVVVQGPGMERWLSQSIARRYGICANTEFLFPRQWLDRIFEALPDERSDLKNSGWELGQLTWSVARLLAEGRGDPDFEPLARHLEAADGDWRLVQLAHQIAALIDQTITFRPEWIRDWCAASALPEERDERWQARLVRDLTSLIGPGHFADRATAFLSAAEKPDRITKDLARVFPGGIEIFAVSTLPPLYLSVINGLARCADVHLSILSPTESYWADLWREVRDGDLLETESGEEPGLFDVGPATPAARLLAGLGRLGGDFQRCLEEVVVERGSEVEDYVSPIEGARNPSLLERLQADLLELGPGPDPTLPDPSRVVSGDDDSIQVHFCHGPRRELEVVEAALREAFERDATLTPEDVIVMAPQIDTIAPDIEAVFGVPREDGQSIPYRIADRGALKRSPVAETFRGLLELLGGRAGRSEVLDWLAGEPARARFGLDEEAVERFAEWAEGSGIRFGLDEDHRESLGLAPARRHTWAAGLERLALAHAVGASAEVFEGTAPVPLDPFSDPDVLGAVGELESMLRSGQAMISSPRDVSSWCQVMIDLLERSCDQTDSNAQEHSTIRGLLQGISAGAESAGFEEVIPFEAIREQVCDALGSSPAPQAFLAGGVTFCELVPLRAIPFKVIAIMGMSDTAFPRGGPALGFDLMARSPRAGDRSTRNDDRYLFLEALLSARDRLILTVPGRDVRDGSDLPPSIVVSELLDTVDASFVLNPGAAGSLREALIVRHPLQAFSPRYFETSGDPRLISRDAEAFAGAKAQEEAREAGGGKARQFLNGLVMEEAVPDETKGPKRLGLDEMVDRILRATRSFARDQIRLRLPRMGDVVGDLDPVGLAPLEQFALGAALLDDLLVGATPEEAVERLAARAAIPEGVPGALAARALREEVAEIARMGRARCSGVRLPDVETTIELKVEGLGSCALVGSLDRLWPEGRIQVGFGRIDRRGEFDVWIRHLFLCAAVEDGLDYPAKSILVGRTKDRKSVEHVVVFEPVADSKSHLARLFEWAWLASTSPLPFFPKASKDFAELALEGKLDQAWRKAQQTYYGGDSGGFLMPEFDEELEHARLWEGVSPLEPGPDMPLRFRFDELAETFFQPLFAARQVEIE